MIWLLEKNEEKHRKRWQSGKSNEEELGGLSDTESTRERQEESMSGGRREEAG